MKMIAIGTLSVPLEHLWPGPGLQALPPGCWRASTTPAWSDSPCWTWTGKGEKNERINKNICRYIFCSILYFSKSTEQDLFFSSLTFLLNIVHPTIREVTAKLNLILRQRKEMQRNTFWRDFYFVVLHTSSAVVPLCSALSGVGRSCRPSSGLISVMRNSNHG